MFETARTDVRNNQDVQQPPAKSQHDCRSLPKATGKTAPANPEKSVFADAAYADCTPDSNRPVQSSQNGMLSDGPENAATAADAAATGVFNR